MEPSNMTDMRFQEKDGYTQTKTGEGINVPYYQTQKFIPKQCQSIEINSIKKYGGFYIGRYEVGV